MSAKKVGFALFGLGRMGQIHAKNIMWSGRATLKWIVRNNLEDAQKFVGNYSLPARCATPASLQQVYNDPEVDAVLICSPTSTHEPIINDALNLGKAVFCEKPITSSVQTTENCYNKAEKNKQPLFCAFHRKFDPSCRRIFDSVKSGNLGNVRLVKMASRDLQPPPIDYIRTSGGILSDSTIHDLNQSLWLAGSKPKTVYVQGTAFNPEIKECGDLDQVLVTIQFENGVLSYIDNGRSASFGYDQRMEVLCEHGQLSMDNRDSDHVTTHGSLRTEVPRIHSDFSDCYREAYVNELDHFLDVMEGKSEMLVSKEDTLNTMKLASACYESLRTKMPVQYSDHISNLQPVE